MPAFVAAWLITVLIEAPCVSAFYPGQRRRMALTCAVATSVTNLCMNLLLPRWLGVGERFLIVGETAALILEALTYYYSARGPRDLARATLASALANALSFGAGECGAVRLFS